MSATPVTTLVVDDESMVRTLVRRMLEPEVCAVVEAESGESALRLIEQGELAIDLVLTDLVMPGIDGFDLVQVLSRHRPDLPVVCMSGFAAPSSRRLTVPLVRKPFTLESLRSALAPVLAAGRLGRTAGGGATHGIGGNGVDLVAEALGLRRRRAEPPDPS